MLLVGSLCILALGASIAQSPGSSKDPLISRSYVDQFFRFGPMVLARGGKIELNMGALIVIRSGKTKLIAPRDKTLIDLTNGKEIKGDEILPLNHLILVPDSAEYGLSAESLTMILAMGLSPELNEKK